VLECGRSVGARQHGHPADDAEIIDGNALGQGWLLNGLEAELLDDADDRHGALVDGQVAGVNAGLDRPECLADGGAATDG
jgi:hypothetical protein